MTGPARRVAERTKRKVRKRAVGIDSGSSTEDLLTRRQSAIALRVGGVLSALGLPGSGTPKFGDGLSDLQAALRAAPDNRELLWFAHLAVVGRYPVEDDLLRLESAVHTYGAEDAVSGLLDENVRQRAEWCTYAEIEFLTCPVVDVSSTATIDTHTGIQRVVRETVRRWTEDHETELVIWDPKGGAFRRATATERRRITDFTPAAEEATSVAETTSKPALVAPLRTTFVLPEHCADMRRSLAIGAIGLSSGSEVVAIFYDFIEQSMPETLSEQLRVELSNTIPALRSCQRVSAISNSAGRELGGFSEMLPNLGLRPLDIRCHTLPIDPPVQTTSAPDPEISRLIAKSAGPLISSISRIEPRKNQITTLRVAESLWAQGYEFQLLFVGWNKANAVEFNTELARLQELGRPITMIPRATESLVWSAYRQARFSVFISLAEGYGLPAAESISVGTPVLLSDFGPMAEVGAPGGACLVDPRDFRQVRDGFRRLLEDDAYLAELKTQAAAREFGSWDEYAAVTWAWLVNAAG